MPPIRLCCLTLLILLACTFGSWAQEALSYAGATTLQRFFMPEAALIFHQNTGHVVKIRGGNTTPGICALLRHEVDMAGAGRHLTEAEKQQGLVEHFLGWDILAVILHTSNPVETLAEEQLQGIFSGRIKNWQEVGGSNQPIAVINPPEGSGMRQAVHHLVLKQEAFLPQEIISPSVADCDQLVALFPSGITALSRSMLDSPQVKSIQLGGKEPTPKALKDGSYAYAKPLILVTNGPPEGALANFISLATGNTGQNILDTHFVSKR